MKTKQEDKTQELAMLQAINENENTKTIFFEEVISKNEKRGVKIKYDSGETPGDIREIIPHRINTKTGMLYAHCVNSQKNKSYYIRYITVLNPEKMTTKEQMRAVTVIIWIVIIAVSIWVTIRFWNWLS